MASVYKRRRRKPIPNGAEIVRRKGQQVAVWTNLRTGRKQRAPVSEDGTAIVITADTYTVEWFDHERRRRRKGTRIADKDAALQLANKLETDAMRRREGLVDAQTERHKQESCRPLSEHIDDSRALRKLAVSLVWDMNDHVPGIFHRISCSFHPQLNDTT